MLRALALTAALTTVLAGCGPSGGVGGTDGAGHASTSDALTGDVPTSTKETSMTSSTDHREAARAERPATDALVREVSAGLTPQDPDEVAADGWVHGATTACSWKSGGPLSWTSRGQMRAADPEAQVLALAESLDPRWEKVDTSSTTARHFQDADGYLLTLAWGTDPDYINVAVESPCHG